MDIPDFSIWQKFDDFRKDDISQLPGVYILAHYDKVPRGIPITTSPKIIYVGETTKQKLTKRLYDFERSAFLQVNGHSGGWTYSDKILKNIKQKSAPDNLYVSALAVDRPEIESKAYIKLIERLVIWEFYQKNKRYPECNMV